MCPGDCGLNDRYVVQDVIKEMASSKNIAAFNKGNNNGEGTTALSDKNKQQLQQQQPTYKVVVLLEVDKLTRPAQAALRRTMEKYSGSCRLILCCNNPSRVIDPVRSRCLGIRVGAPSVDEVRVTLIDTSTLMESNFNLGRKMTASCALYCRFQLMFSSTLF